MFSPARGSAEVVGRFKCRAGVLEFSWRQVQKRLPEAPVPRLSFELIYTSLGEAFARPVASFWYRSFRPPLRSLSVFCRSFVRVCVAV